jgi:hypothetical protein
MKHDDGIWAECCVVLRGSSAYAKEHTGWTRNRTAASSGSRYIQRISAGVGVEIQYIPTSLFTHNALAHRALACLADPPDKPLAAHCPLPQEIQRILGPLEHRGSLDHTVGPGPDHARVEQRGDNLGLQLLLQGLVLMI